MIILLNGPLGIGKSTLAETLVERLDAAVMLDGDALIAVNPEPPEPLDHLHAIVVLLVRHYEAAGYRHFVVNHLWRSPAELADLVHRFPPTTEVHRFLLSLPLAENLHRIARRAQAREIDELAFELETVSAERELLESWRNGEVGELFPVDASPAELAERLMRRVGLVG